jgi:salicylate hydroxylase
MVQSRASTMPMKIIITGGGIGGLTTALCLLRAGFDVTVLEQATALTEVGAGLQISPNSARVFAALGVLPAIEARAFRPEALERDG